MWRARAPLPTASATLELDRPPGPHQQSCAYCGCDQRNSRSACGSNSCQMIPCERARNANKCARQISNSPWIRGAPHSGLAMLISRISLRISVGKVGRPPRRRDLQRQYDLNPARCHFITVFGFKTARAFRAVGANRYSPAKIKRSMALNVCLLGECRLSMLI